MLYPMPVYLQPVPIPERCFLFEVLLWVAFVRLPIAIGDPEGADDIRLSSELRQDGYSVKIFDEYIFDEECERVGIPPDPRWRANVDGTTTLSIEHYDTLLKQQTGTKEFRNS